MKKRKTEKKATVMKKTKKKNVNLAQKELTVGDTVPDLVLPATGEQQVSLKDLNQKVVLYFYPKDDTPGCTTEGHDFTQLHDAFKANGVEVFGVSKDSLTSHEKFKTKQNYSVDLISDEEQKLCQALGVMKEKNMYGRKYMGIERSTFILDETGRIEKEWRGVKVPGHAKEVLEYIKGWKS